MAGPGGPGVRELAAAGVRRVSVGTAIARAAYGLAERATRESLGAGRTARWSRAWPARKLNALLS
jgi:2-methylisocitrate lyase-like PEP mutase family enzyme